MKNLFKKRVEIIIIGVMTVAVSVLGNNFYNSYTFNNNDIPDSYKQQIYDKEQEILQNMQTKFGFMFKVPLIVTDKLGDNLYGLTTSKNGEIKIYLNKNVMQESMDYMLDNIIAHEYAHAILFKRESRDNKGAARYYGEKIPHSKECGHSVEWKDTCIKLGGDSCQQYVDQEEIVKLKMPL